MAPHVRAEAAKAGLYLVRNKQSTSIVDHRGNLGEIALRQLRKTLAREGGAKEHRGQLDTVALEVSDGVLQVPHISIPKLFVTASIALSVGVYYRNVPNERTPLGWRREHRTDLRNRSRVAVIGIGGGDYSHVARALACDPQRQLVRFTAGAGKENTVQRGIES